MNIKKYEDAVEVIRKATDLEVKRMYKDYRKLHFEDGYLEENCLLSQYRDVFASLRKEGIFIENALAAAEKELLQEIARRWANTVS